MDATSTEVVCYWNPACIVILFISLQKAKDIKVDLTIILSYVIKSGQMTTNHSCENITHYQVEEKIAV